MRTLFISTVHLSAIAILCSCSGATTESESQSGAVRSVSRPVPGAINAFGQTKLHIAAVEGRTDAVEQLLADGAAIDAGDRWGWTPLTAAIEVGEMEMVKLLISHGADVNATNHEGWTALNLAALLGKSEIASLLLDSGAEVSTTNRSGETVLHSAAKNWHKEFFVLLWEKGADLDASDATGVTARQIVDGRGFQWKKLYMDKTGVLPQTWVFRQEIEEGDDGEKQNWKLVELPDDHWRPISTETFWTDQPFPGLWHGAGWYRIDFTVEELGVDPEKLAKAPRVLLTFGAIDGYPKVWINGTLVGEHTEDLNITWDDPWDVDVTKVIKLDGVNILAVKCTKTAYAAGIHPGVDKQPVRLVGAAKVGVTGAEANIGW